MREIWFRGKCSHCDEWCYGNLIDYGSDEYPEIHGFDPFREGIDRWREIAVDRDTVGQYTGFKDKNGKEIYEGDIVECVSWNEYFSDPATGTVMEPFRRKMYIEFRKGGFKMIEPMPSPMTDNEWDIIYNGDIVVIGNVFENPDILSLTNKS